MSLLNGYHLAYDCSRKLGKIGLTGSISEFIEEKGLGPDPFQPDFDLARFKKAVGGTKGAIKPALMNQQVMAGIGNIYSDEILFQARVHPKAPAGKLDDASLERLYSEMKDHVLPAAVKARAKPDRLPSSFIIPNRKKEGECPGCGGPLIKEPVSGRPTYYCPRCQGKRTG
jgi:formamidopyrimidine-DNA glycosylase